MLSTIFYIVKSDQEQIPLSSRFLELDPCSGKMDLQHTDRMLFRKMGRSFICGLTYCILACFQLGQIFKVLRYHL